jgi:hypothetical protein
MYEKGVACATQPTRYMMTRPTPHPFPHTHTQTPTKHADFVCCVRESARAFDGAGKGTRAVGANK